MTKIAMFTGSVDPITNGHMDIIARASKLFDELYIGLFYNKDKQGFWDIETRKRILEEVVADFPNVKVITAHDSLAVDVARDLGVTYLVEAFVMRQILTMRLIWIISIRGWRLSLKRFI